MYIYIIFLDVMILSCVLEHTGMLNPLKPELNPICYLLALLGAHHFSPRWQDKG